MTTEKLADVSHKLTDAKDLDPLLNAIGDARIVMLGEASHGTHEYYTWRMQLSRRLMEEKGFNFISVEGDWPDCYGINRYVKNYPDSGSTAEEVIRKFERWPTWMWANWEVVAFSEWLRRHNMPRSAQNRVGFYGLDVYSLWESLDAIMDYLQKEDPQAAEYARRTISCLEPYRDDEGGISYARAQRWMPKSCEKEVIELLRTVRSRSNLYDMDPEGAFNAEQNARIAVNAEKYYRIMIDPGPQSWNLRDEHMMTTLNKLLDYHGANSKAIVWEHNTHIGDARFTDMSSAGMFNIGQLAREQWGEDRVRLVGFGSYQGTVTAGRFWGAPTETMELPPARESSWEHMLQQTGDNLILLSEDLKKFPELQKSVLHRAVGVVYNPERERHSNYVPTKIAKRYDAFVFLKESQALHPLHVEGTSHRMPETFPWNF
jgi:erythromycin esterase